MNEAIARAQAEYPPPWIVGWWRSDDGRWSVEVNRPVGYARYERIVIATGAEGQNEAAP